MCWTPIHQEDVGNPFKNFHLAVWREKALVLRFLVRNSTCWVAVDGLKMLPMKFTAMILRGTLGVMLLHYQLQGNTPNCSTKSFCTVAIEVFSRFTWFSLFETTLYHAFMESLCICSSLVIALASCELWLLSTLRNAEFLHSFYCKLNKDLYFLESAGENIGQPVTSFLYFAIYNY